MSSFDEVMATVMRLHGSMEVLGSIAARASLGSAESANPRLVAALDRVLSLAEVPSLGELTPEQRMQITGFIRSFFAQTQDLVMNPAREPGWSYTDVGLIEGIGKASTLVPRLFSSAPELKAARSFLDVGTGVGWLAIAITRLFPESTVVGIDTHETSLERARMNVAEARLAQRITLRNQDVALLDDVEAFDAVWIPSFFIDQAKLSGALAAVYRALRPGGVTILGFYEAPHPLARELMALRVLRDGGSSLSEDEARGLLAGSGHHEVHMLERTWQAPIAFALGRKP